VRVLDLKPDFYRTRRVHAPHGSLEDKAVRGVLGALASDRSPLPLEGDEEALRTPFTVIYAHPVPGANLVVTYAFELPMVEILTVRPAYR
jgi:hypothetical protein